MIKKKLIKNRQTYGLGGPMHLDRTKKIQEHKHSVGFRARTNLTFLFC